MKIIEQSHEILHITPNILEQIEIAARNCYKSEEAIKKGSAEKIVKMLVKKNHGAMLEFGDIYLRLITSRSVLAELTRHRLASFAVESQRYVNYKEGIEFIKPDWCSDNIFRYRKSNSYENLTDAEKFFIFSCTDAEYYYKKLIKEGLRPEQAREVLPNSVKTEIVMKANVREMIHILKLRTSKKAHPMIRSLFSRVLNELKTKIPVVFDNITED